MEDELDGLKKGERARKDRIEKLKNIVHSLEHEIAHPPEVEDIQVINADLVRQTLFLCSISVAIKFTTDIRYIETK